MQRQRLPDSPIRTSSSVGFGFAASSAVAEISIPGVQKPHWTPPWSRNALLQRRQGSPDGEPLDRRDRAALGLQREVGARVHRLAVEQHHAGAALGVVAALLGAGETDVVADGVEKAGAGLELDRVGDAVDGQGGCDLHDASVQPGWRDGTEPRAVSIARRAITAAIARR